MQISNTTFVPVDTQSCSSLFKCAQAFKFAAQKDQNYLHSYQLLAVIWGKCALWWYVWTDPLKLLPEHHHYWSFLTAEQSEGHTVTPCSQETNSSQFNWNSKIIYILNCCWCLCTLGVNAFKKVQGKMFKRYTDYVNYHESRVTLTSVRLRVPASSGLMNGCSFNSR